MKAKTIVSAVLLLFIAVSIAVLIVRESGAVPVNRTRFGIARRHRAAEALDDGDTGRLADTAAAGTDSTALAPGLETAAPELLALVRDDVARSPAVGPNGPLGETLDLGGGRDFLENGEADAHTGVQDS